MTIRRARRSDSEGFLELLLGLARFEKLEPPDSKARLRIIKDIFEKKRIKLLLAVFDGVPVGYALYFFAYSSFLARPTLYLEDIFVSEPYRRLSAGKSLFLRCAREAIRRGCGRMEWAILNWNRKALRFYEKLGAEKLNEWSYYRLDQRHMKSFESMARKRRGQPVLPC
jgi:GNAT superfamily N-acetyltransferase